VTIAVFCTLINPKSLVKNKNSKNTTKQT
jgi:hypothetical protein